jgi:hypothetical protein
MNRRDFTMAFGTTVAGGSFVEHGVEWTETRVGTLKVFGFKAIVNDHLLEVWCNGQDCWAGRIDKGTTECVYDTDVEVMSSLLERLT